MWVRQVSESLISSPNDVVKPAMPEEIRTTSLVDNFFCKYMRAYPTVE